MRSIHYGTSLLMLVAAAMAGCAVESADLSDGEMGEDFEMVNSSEAALEAMLPDDAEITDPQMGSQGVELGTPPERGTVIIPQHGFVPSQKGFLPIQHGFVPQKGLVSIQHGFVSPQTGLISSVGTQLGSSVGLGTVQYGQCPSKLCPPPSKLCPPPAKLPPPSKLCPPPSKLPPPSKACPLTQYPIYPQR